MDRAKAAGKGIGRPQKIIDKDKLIALLAENHSKARIAKSLGISKATLYKKLSELR
jgi:DNA invertase Pin-like site-specific DNA recombinase